MITAFVSEYFGGTQNGLGSRITSNMTANTAAAWAYVLGACLLGLAFYLVSILLESIITQHRGGSPGEEPHEEAFMERRCRGAGARRRGVRRR